MINNKKVTAIVLVAGNSTRFGKNKNKNFEILNDKTIIEYSLNVFDNNKFIDDIIIAVREKDISLVNNIISKINNNKKIFIVIGGNSRRETVYKCLLNTDSDIVIIHDGARPNIKDIYIDKCLESMSEYKGVTLGVKSKDTIKITNDNNIVINTTLRNNTWLIQTPQCFYRKILLEMHEKYDDEVTDDCSLLEKEYDVKIIEGDYSNIKITNYNDIKVIKEYLDFNKKKN